MPKSKHSSPTLVVKITPENHERAVKSQSGGCLIADAIKDQYPHLSKVTVDMATVRASDRKTGQRYTYLTPPQAQHLLLSFDQGWPQATEEIVLRRAVKITSITRPKTGVNSTQATLEKREARKAALEEKVASGEELSKNEKISLTQLSTPATPAPDRPSAFGPRDVKVDRKGTVVHGGPPLPQGQPHPNLLRGRDRHFGAKLADPGQAFQDAVDQAVAEKLAEQSSSI